MTTPGISSFAHWRFGAAVALHVLAWLLFFETGAFGPVALPQGLVSFCIAFAIVATLAWQWKCLGDPHEPHNFIIHLLLLATVFFLIVRLQSPLHRDFTVMDAVAATAKWAAGVVGIFPPQLFQVLASPVTAVFFLVTCFALSLQRHFAIGLMVALVSAAVALALGQPHFGALPPFLGGLACLGVAVWLQFNNAEERHFWRQVFARLEADKAVRGDMELKHRLLKRLLREGRPITEQECMATIERALDRHEHDPLLQQTAVRVVRQMVRSDGLVVMQDDSRGRTLALNPDLYTTPTDTFAMIAVVPRTICVLAVAVLWVISPIDLIPDALPGVGMLDDTVVTLLSGAVVSNLFVWLKAWKRKGPTDAKGYLNNV